MLAPLDDWLETGVARSIPAPRVAVPGQRLLYGNDLGLCIFPHRGLLFVLLRSLPPCGDETAYRLVAGRMRSMYETSDDLATLQSLLDGSFAQAGPHLVSIVRPERRLTAPQVSERLRGMCLLAVATVTGDGRPIIGAVDGVFYRSAFYFGSSEDSVRYAHLQTRPQVSATHLPSEALQVTVHGTAKQIEVRDPANAGFRAALLEVNVPRYGESWGEFLDSGVVYWRIDAARMFTFWDPSLLEP